MNNILNFIDEANEMVENAILDLDRVSADKLGLDIRAGYSIYVDVDNELLIINKRDRRNLDYYGGFEYVDEEYVNVLGDWIIYNNDHDRIAECLDRYYENK